jgi:CubicO group peptidase (beta-lactamase class C family)
MAFSRAVPVRRTVEWKPLEGEAMRQSRVDQMLNRHAAVGLAVGVVRDGSLEFFHGHGYASLGLRTPVTPDTVFRVASITKTFTAIAVMQLWEQGRLDLDGPADEYLRAFRLVPAKATIAIPTVRQLLTHTAGLPEVRRPRDVFKPIFGETVPAGHRIPPLAEFYRDGLPVDCEPGTRFAYTDHAFATLGQIVEDVSGEPFDRYLRGNVFEPLGMSNTDLIRSPRVQPNLATGYTIGARGVRPVDDYEVVTAGAGAAYSSVRDMATYVAALLGSGSILKPATLAMMFEPQYQPDPRVPGLGLAFWRGEAGGHRVVEHGGILTGYHSQIFVAPDAGVGVLAFTNGARGAMLWLPAEVGGLLSAELGVPEPAIRTDIPQRPDLWPDLCGWYAAPGRLSDARTREIAGAGIEVFVRRGQLMMRVLSPLPAVYRGFPLHPDDENDPYVFRIDLSGFGMGTVRIIFSQRPGLGTTAAHLDVYPMTAYKRPGITNPRRLVAGAAGALAAGWLIRRTLT